MWSYDIFTFSFADNAEFLEQINEKGEDGWIYQDTISTTPDSPEAGITTKEILFARPK